MHFTEFIFIVVYYSYICLCKERRRKVSFIKCLSEIQGTGNKVLNQQTINKRTQNVYIDLHGRPPRPQFKVSELVSKKSLVAGEGPS